MMMRPMPILSYLCFGLVPGLDEDFFVIAVKKKDSTHDIKKLGLVPLHIQVANNDVVLFGRLSRYLPPLLA